jgi:hypothetical protein
MQTVYIGNTLVNDVMLGSQRMGDILLDKVSIVTSGLTAYFDASFNASASSWRATTGNYTASIGGTIYNSTYPQNYQLTSSIAGITYGLNTALSSASLSGTGSRTMITFISPASSSTDATVVWTGDGAPGNPGLKFLVTSSSLNLKIISDRTASPSTETFTGLGSLSLNNWFMAAYTTDGTDNTNGITVWLNNASQSFSNGGTWLVAEAGTRYWETGAINAQFPFRGRIAFHLVYNRKLSDAEMIQNYDYFKLRFGLV